jgi:predicted RNase H-like HicB family nuclease
MADPYAAESQHARLFQGRYSQGDTTAEALDNIREAIELGLEDAISNGCRGCR